jgi:hypothetical protein
MTVREFKDLLSSVTYKPGWKFEASQYWDHRGWLHVMFFHLEPNVAMPGKTTTVMHLHTCDPQDMEPRHAIAWLRAMILDAEEHEFKEFFRVGGVAPYPAHPEMLAVRIQDSGVVEVKVED